MKVQGKKCTRWNAEYVLTPPEFRVKYFRIMYIWYTTGCLTKLWHKYWLVKNYRAASWWFPPTTTSSMVVSKRSSVKTTKYRVRYIPLKGWRYNPKKFFYFLSLIYRSIYVWFSFYIHFKFSMGLIYIFFFQIIVV